MEPHWNHYGTVADVHVTAHGVLSVAGVVAFVLGGLLLFSPFDLVYW